MPEGHDGLKGSTKLPAYRLLLLICRVGRLLPSVIAQGQEDGFSNICVCPCGKQRKTTSATRSLQVLRSCAFKEFARYRAWNCRDEEQPVIAP